MKLPRFTSGSIGRLDYKALNQAFTSIENLEGRANSNPNPYGGPVRESFVAKIVGLMTSAVQGANQATSTTETVAGGIFIPSYLYDWVEVSIGTGDGISPAGTGIAHVDLQGARGIDYTSGVTITPPASYYPAIDFTSEQRYSENDLVQLTRIAVRSGSKYSNMYSISPLSVASTSFLARLTSKHGSISGLYEWTGISTPMVGALSNKSMAVNLYELNCVRDCENYSNPLVVNGTSYSGSNNWAHGQDPSLISKLNLPVGAAGTGTIAQLNRGPQSATLTTVTAGAFVIGNTYKIITLGTTTFTSIGAASNTVGVTFTATGVGTGTGTAGYFGRHYYFYSVSPVTCV